MATITERVLVLHAKASSGVSKNTGKAYEMLTVEYLGTADATPTKNVENGDYGYTVVSGSLPYEQKINIDVVPAFYDVEFELSMAFNNGKATQSVKPVSIKFASPLNGAKTK